MANKFIPNFNQVRDVSSIIEFIDRYYKKERINSSLKDYPDYKKTLIKHHSEHLKILGYTLVSRHDNITGQPIIYRGAA